MDRGGRKAGLAVQERGLQVEEERKRREIWEEEADMDQNHMVRRNSKKRGALSLGYMLI